ncbi:type II secretion system F family protein [uncultured Robinsoniella sp.]|uniref:type II secretion system F family protein n=1 Tax=uncultured Robinsoniella sp. TaxID=904190 RepID=UPI00374E8F9F
MILYNYTAKDAAGKIHNGKMEANGDDEFYLFLDNQSWYCVAVSRTDLLREAQNHSEYRFKPKEVALFCREFAIMLSSGMNMLTTLQLLYERCRKAKQKQCYMHMIEAIEKGETLHDAMKKLGKTFPTLLSAMVLAGEASGSLDIVMEKMAQYYERDYRLKGKIQTALIYPMLLLSVTVAVIILLFTVVLPQFFTMFEGQDLNPLTSFYMKLSVFLKNQWYIPLGVIIVIILLLHFLKRDPGFRLGYDKIKLKIPLISKLLEKILISRFANGMSILYSSGISIIRCMDICSTVISNTYLEFKMQRATEQVEKGTSLSQALEEQGLYDSMVWSMIHIGEESGNLDAMFLKLSEYYEEESETATQKMMAIMEPAMLIVIAIIVGSVVASVLIPIYGMYQTI